MELSQYQITMFFQVPAPETSLVQPAPPVPQAASADERWPSAFLFAAGAAEPAYLDHWCFPSDLVAVLNDRALLSNLSADTRCLSSGEMELMSDNQLVARAVAIFSDVAGISVELAANLRDGLALALSRSDDPYLRSVANCYSILPTRHVIASIYDSPDTNRLLDAKKREADFALIPGAKYPEEVLNVHAQLMQFLSVIPTEAEIAARTERAKNYKPSVFMEKLLEIEGRNVPHELVERAKAEMATIIVGVNKALADKFRAQDRRPLTPEQVMQTVFDYLESNFRCCQGNQEYLIDGLASHVFDCDIYTLVYCEIGEQLRLPIVPMMLVDREKGGIAHLMPAFIYKEVPLLSLTGRPETRVLLFEPREPIETSPDGSKRRVYRNDDEPRERINRLAGEEIIPAHEKPFRLSHQNILDIVALRKGILKPGNQPANGD